MKMGNTNELDTGAPIIKMTCVALSIANLLAIPTSASAADITVVDAGCTIVDAVIAANINTATGDCAAGEPDATATDVIILPNNSIQSLTVGYVGGTDNALPVISSDITIQGNGSTLRRDSSSSFRLIKVEGAGTHLTINDLTIENGNTYYNGGGIYANSNSSVSLSNSTVSGNYAYSGGGIYARNSSSVSLSNSTVSGNSAYSFGGGIFAGSSSSVSLSNSTVSGNSTYFGGGIFAESSSSVSLSNSTVSGNSANRVGGINVFSSSISLTNSTVSGNSSTNRSGGIYASNSSVSLTNSTVSGNSGMRGGGIYASNSSVSLTNSTVSGNSAMIGGGIYAKFISSISLTNSTVSGNSAFNGGGISGASSTISLSNSIIANSSNNDDIYDAGSLTLTSDTASIIEQASFSGSQTGDPDLLPLADNGGPTQTHALSYNSIALDTGDTATCTDRDQRGRLRGTPCNVGSFEIGTGDIVVGVAGCTLIDAVRAANTNTAVGGCEPGEPDSFATDMIVLPNNSTQLFTASYAGSDNALPVVTSDITIHGNGSTLRRDSPSSFRLIEVTGPETHLVINDLTIENGYSSYGGGINVSSSSSVSLTNSTVSGNSASINGGGINANDSTIDLTNSIVSGNSAFGFGGGINASNSTIDLTNSTVSGNSTDNGDGGAFNLNYCIVSLANSTVSGNSADIGGGMYAYASNVSITNSIIANSSNSDDVYLTNTPLSSDSASIIEEASYSGSRTGDPGLLPLANNGGLTKTHALKANSIARDSGILSDCTTEDQRGQTRDDGDGKCDVGALEYNPSDKGSDDDSFIVIPLGNGKVAVIPN